MAETNKRVLLKKEEYWAEVRADERNFIQTNFRIRTKKATFEKFRFNDNQNIMHDWALDVMREVGFLRAAILKYRQLGSTLYWTGETATKTVSRRNWRSLITAQHKERSKQVFRIVRNFITQLGEKWEVLEPKFEADSSMELLDEERNSSVTISTAKTPNFVRGDMINWWLMTEVDFYLGEGGSLKTLLEAGLPMIPRERGTGAVMESTANGTDGEYYEIWNQAREGQNGFRALFLQWFMDRNCDKSLHVHDGDAELKARDWAALKEKRLQGKGCWHAWQEFNKNCLDEELRERMKKYNLTAEQMYFYWDYLNSELRGDRLKMMQEFPCDWMEAFIASGQPVWDKRTLTSLRNRSKPGDLYE